MPGDDDKEDLAGAPLGTGTITQLYGDELSFELRGFSGDKTFEFRLGNQDDDQGYVGFDGISGWGWLLHSGNGFTYAGASDWNFTATPDDGNDGGEGLTPGFWKQIQHEEFWGELSRDDSFADVFGVESPTLEGVTLLDALTGGGGGEAAFLRHAVAALLNASNDGVSYEYSVAEVIESVQKAYELGNYEEVKDQFEVQNELGNVDLKA